MLDFEAIKEIADRYGIGVTKADKGYGGFITDETGIVKKGFIDEVFADFFMDSDDLFFPEELSSYSINKDFLPAA